MSPANQTREIDHQVFLAANWKPVVVSSPGIRLTVHNLDPRFAPATAQCHELDPSLTYSMYPSGIVDGPADLFLDYSPVLAKGTNEEWLRTANEELKGVNDEAEEEGLEPPSSEVFEYASAFIDVLSGFSLPPPIVVPDENKGISIQMIDNQFAFLLTCFDGGTGIVNVNHDNYVLEGTYRDLSVDRIKDSDFSRLVGCMVHPIARHHASTFYSK